MNQELEQLKKEIELLKIRNKRVEADKAWETSWVRMLSIIIITYATASTAMCFIGVHDYFANALIPTLGFALSTLSLPTIKRIWIIKKTEYYD